MLKCVDVENVIIANTHVLIILIMNGKNSRLINPISVQNFNLNIIQLTNVVCRRVFDGQLLKTADVTVTKIAGYVRVCILMNR